MLNESERYRVTTHGLDNGLHNNSSDAISIVMNRGLFIHAT